MIVIIAIDFRADLRYISNGIFFFLNTTSLNTVSSAEVPHSVLYSATAFRYGSQNLGKKLLLCNIFRAHISAVLLHIKGFGKLAFLHW